MSVTYQSDIEQAAKSHPVWDEQNAEAIADLYGMDPRYVLQDIIDVRKTLDPAEY